MLFSYCCTVGCIMSVAPVNKRKVDILDSLYTDGPASFGGPSRLHAVAKAAGFQEISLNDCKRFLAGQDSYTRFKPARRRYTRARFRIQWLADLCEADTFFFREVDRQSAKEKASAKKKHLAGDKEMCLLLCQDVFSKYCWIFRMKGKGAVQVYRALHKLFVTLQYNPKQLYTDKDDAYSTPQLQKLYKQ